MGFRRNHVLERYTPAEAEMVTGVNVALQRDWRRRELLPAVDGHARYTGAELAEMVLMKDFADRKLGPKALRNLLGVASGPLSDWVEAQPGRSDVLDIEGAVLADQLPARYLVFAGDRAISTASLDDTLQSIPPGPDRRIVIVCNLRSVAEDVVAKVPRPVWRRKDEGRAS